MAKRIISLFLSHKWWISIGFFTSFIFCFINIFLGAGQSGGKNFSFVFISTLPLFFVSGVTAEIFNKSSKIISTVSKALLISFWEFLIYLFVFTIGFLVIIQRAWENGMFQYNWIFLFLPAVYFMMLSFIPMNLLSGFLVFGLRKARNK
jgi:hypothetical protein